MEIIWTERKDNKGPLFGTIINTEKVEDNFLFEHSMNKYKYGFPVGRIINLKGECNYGL